MLREEEDEGIWAAMSSGIWNECGPDELGMTREQLLPNGISSLSKDEACNRFLKAAQTGLMSALKDLHIAFGDDLLQFTDEDGYTALHRGSYNGHLNVVEYLIGVGANVHARTGDGWQPLHCACRWNKVDVAYLLLQNGGVSCNACTNGGQTPLHLAACNDKAKMTLELLLLQDDIDVTLRNSKGETARGLAISYGRHGYLFEMKDDGIDFKF